MARRKNQITHDMIQPQQAEIENMADWGQALQLFLRECRIRNLSEHTLKYYRNELTALERTLATQDQPTDPSKITRKMIRENIILYMMDVLERKESAINARLRAARAFFNYLEAESIILENPMKGVSLVKQKKVVIETFKNDQMRLLLRQPNQSTFTGLRDYTIMLLMLETGIRLKELCGIRMSHVNLVDGFILITEGKGFKERTVPIQATMRKQLSKYMTLRGNLETDLLFVTIDDTPLTRRQVQNMVSKYGRLAGIKNVRCSPHTFRHTFARMSVQNGADIFSLQAVLGHTSMDMVRNYVNLFSADVQKNHQKFSPIERLF